ISEQLRCPHQTPLLHASGEAHLPCLPVVAHQRTSYWFPASSSDWPSQPILAASNIDPSSAACSPLSHQLQSSPAPSLQLAVYSLCMPDVHLLASPNSAQP